MGLGITPAVMKRCHWVRPVLVAIFVSSLLNSALVFVLLTLSLFKEHPCWGHFRPPLLSRTVVPILTLAAGKEIRDISNGESRSGFDCGAKRFAGEASRAICAAAAGLRV